MYVIVKTDNENRGDDCILAVYGLYMRYADALDVCMELRAELPDGVSQHEDNPIDYGVMELTSP